MFVTKINWNYCHTENIPAYYRFTPEYATNAERHTDEMLKIEVTDQSTSSFFNFLCFLVNKNNNEHDNNASTCTATQGRRVGR